MRRSRDLRAAWGRAHNEIRRAVRYGGIEEAKRGFVQRTQYGADGRRVGIGLTAEGRRAARSDVLVHGGNIRRHVLDSLGPGQTSLIRAWSEETVDRLEPHRGGPSSDGDS
ncbi:hypothetical protein [Streptomyces sp. NPDC010273]|uniref:hypothetical protein n=1 Tax=Streptomyces sp. NPDC010273 TaxID=3364829 RepID=UPI0036E19BB5